MKHLFTFENYSINEEAIVYVDDEELKQIADAIAKGTKLGELQNLFKQKGLDYKALISMQIELNAGGQTENMPLYDYFVAVSTTKMAPDSIMSASQNGKTVGIKVTMKQPFPKSK